ncbi:MAG: peptidylprolyl isomerase [Candidatus Omnitrophica bacterium]|nr:peptidylprolyl isomerase [Candidatus Omnitrophota bacterium]
MKKISVSLIAFLFLLNIVPTACLWAEELTVDRIVAIVNNEVICQSDVNRILAAFEAEIKSLYTDPDQLSSELRRVKENIVNQMVEEKLILSEAKKYEIYADEEKIEARIEQIKSSFPSEEDFELALELQGLTLEDLMNRFRDQDLMKKVVDIFVRATINIGPMEIKKFFEENSDEFLEPERAHVKSISIAIDEDADEEAALEKAKMVLEKLNSGEEFEDLARRYSQGLNAEEGGDIGLIKKGQLKKEIDEEIFSLSPGGVTEIIKVGSSYRIFKVEQKLAARKLSLAEAQDIIEDTLYKEEFSKKFKEFIDKLKADAYIMIK